ncbi:MAG TPA: thiamine pyrophosphate-dependent dehydrogenase E1 component subunit alpha [Chloroflexota bacterium]|nr:thiamine pyrophosphate-dependent dehydrogenase E1 component subunit alpha [Chloroflexota bacterium]
MASLDSAAASSLLRTMLLIRAFEEKVSEMYAKVEIAGLLHLSIGQEAVAAAISSLLRKDDAMYSGHRAHGHALAKGADPARLLAEIAGRADGYCGGKGGSMHLSAPEVSFMTATGVVGGTIPLALGSALAFKERGQGNVAVVFFGDGAMNSGSFSESLNIASLWKLPVVFICENNGYAEFTPISAHTLVERASEHAALFRIPSETVDGNDLMAVLDAATPAVSRARAGEGPSLVECLTYRLRGHYEGDPNKYRELSEMAEWKAKDPIQRFTALGLVPPEQVSGIEAEVRSVVERAADFARSSPRPSDAASQVYA